MKYGIYMHTAYLKGDGWQNDIELWKKDTFEHLEDACKFLGKNSEMLCDEFPIESFEIKIIKP